LYLSSFPTRRSSDLFSSEVVDRYNIVPQGFSAEMIASQWSLTREELDAFSLESHQKAAAATDRGDFKREILPIDVKFENEKTTLDRKSTRLNSSHVS